MMKTVCKEGRNTPQESEVLKHTRRDKKRIKWGDGECECAAKTSDYLDRVTNEVGVTSVQVMEGVIQNLLDAGASINDLQRYVFHEKPGYEELWWHSELVASLEHRIETDSNGAMHVRVILTPFKKEVMIQDKLPESDVLSRKCGHA